MRVPPAALAERRARAAARLARARPGRWYFAVLGLALDADRVELDDATALERVTEPPTEAELAAALTEPRLFAYLGRVAPLVGCEIVVERRPGAGAESAAVLARLIVTALSLRTEGDLHVLAQADHPWSALAAIVDGRCSARLVDEVPPGRIADSPVMVGRRDLEWAWTHRKLLADLLDTPRFRLACDALAGHHAETNRRLAVAKLWCGVEALLQPDDNRLRLAAAATMMLESTAAGRRDTYRRLERLLGERRAILAGRAFDGPALESHARALRALLSRLLVFFTNRGELPEGTRLDDLLFWYGRSPNGEG